MEELDRYPRTLQGTYLKDYFRRDLYVVSPKDIGDILAIMLIMVFLSAFLILMSVLGITFLRAVLFGGDDVLGIWLRSIRYLAWVVFRF